MIDYRELEERIASLERVVKDIGVGKILSQGAIYVAHGAIFLDGDGLHLREGTHITDELIGPLDLLDLLRGFRDDFMGSAVSDMWTQVTSGTGASIAIGGSQYGGDCVLKTGTDDNGYAQIHFNDKKSLNSTQGYTVMWGMKLTDASNARFDFTLYRDADNYICVRFDTDASITTWYLHTREDANDTSGDSGETVDTDDHLYKLTVTSSAVNLYIDDMETAKVMNTTNINPHNSQPVITMYTRNTTSKDCHLDFVIIIPTSEYY